jgi:hypothetical protein
MRRNDRSRMDTPLLQHLYKLINGGPVGKINLEFALNTTIDSEQDTYLRPVVVVDCNFSDSEVQFDCDMPI